MLGLRLLNYNFYGKSYQNQNYEIFRSATYPNLKSQSDSSYIKCFKSVCTFLLPLLAINTSLTRLSFLTINVITQKKKTSLLVSLLSQTNYCVVWLGWWLEAFSSWFKIIIIFTECLLLIPISMFFSFVVEWHICSLFVRCCHYCIFGLEQDGDSMMMMMRAFCLSYHISSYNKPITYPFYHFYYKNTYQPRT